MTQKEGSTWTKARTAKFRATMAAKKAAKVAPSVTSIPLDAIPERVSKAPAKKVTVRAVPVHSNKQQLVHDVVRLLLHILEAQ